VGSDQVVFSVCWEYFRMGLIKKVFGAIFGLIGSIIGAILGVFGVGKKSEFFLELDEADSGAKGDAASEGTAAPASATAPQATPSQASAPAKSSSSAPEKTAPAPQQQPKPAAEPAPLVTSAAKTAKPAPDAGTFATDYLVNPKLSTGGRRRPGPSLSPFKDLARQVKTPAR
jgi:hypothetical protein